MNDLMTTDRREHPEAAAVAEAPADPMTRGAAAGPGRVGRVLSLVRLHLLVLRGPVPSLLGLLLIFGSYGLIIGSIAPVSGFLAGTALVGGLSGVMADRSGINRLLASLPVSRADVVNSYTVCWPLCPSPGPTSSIPTGRSRCCSSWPPRPSTPSWVSLWA